MKCIQNRFLALQSIFVFILCIVSSMVMNSCCAKVYCTGADDLGDIYLMNFTSDEIDSVFVVSYEKGSDFKTVIDSFLVPRSDSINNGRFDLFLGGKKISAGNDNRIYILKANKIYKITGFRTSKAECNGCSISFIRDSYTQLNGYEINDKFKSLGYIEIDKSAD
jgi:hypothetical protein